MARKKEVDWHKVRIMCPTAFIKWLNYSQEEYGTASARIIINLHGPDRYHRISTYYVSDLTRLIPFFRDYGVELKKPKTIGPMFCYAIERAFKELNTKLLK